MSIIFFDKDGVIVDSEGAYLKRNKQFLNSLGIEVKESELLKLVGSNPKRDANLYKKWIKGKYSWSGFQDLRNAFFQTLDPIDFLSLKMPHLEETLYALKSKGHHLSIVSSSSLTGIQNIVNMYHINLYFDYLISGDFFKESKPNPAIYNYAKDKYGVEEKMYAVEDSTLGIIAAKKAGLIVIAKRDLRYGFDQTQADYLINDLHEIVNIVI